METEKLFFSNLIKMNDPTAEDCNVSDLQVDACESNIDMNTMWECDTNPNQRGRIDAPTYSNNFSTVLQDPEKEGPTKLKNAPPRNSCFNCMGGHLISECPLPRDQRAITKNRREFMNKTSGFFRQASRYHLGEDQMYAHMVPGQISKSLRHALGLSRNQLPLHVYRMRLFGYPPGWLEDARVSRSGIALYVGSHGNEIPSPDDEEGEIITDGSKDTYDVSKIHEFPGFNIPPDPDMIDESRYHHCPPLRQDQSKEIMVKNLELQSATASSYKKRASIPTHSKRDLVIIDSDGDPNSNSAEELPGSSSEEATTKDQVGCISPTLEELEAQKKQLMEELLRKSAAAELASSSNEMDVVVPGEVDTLPSERCQEIAEDCKEINECAAVSSSADGDLLTVPKDTDSSLHTKLDSVLSDSASGAKDQELVKYVELGTPTTGRATPYSRTCVTPVTKIGTVKQIEQGTPILKSASPYSLLPSPDKFSKGICDVINFENLPDSLGHYKRMNEVIHSVRNHLKRQ